MITSINEYKIFESNSRDLLIVDIQPEYLDAIYFDLIEFGEYLTSKIENSNVTYLYNGSETVGGVTEFELIQWLIETCGVDEDDIYNITFYDKGYAFFREVMDDGYESQKIVDWMIDTRTYNSNDPEFNEIKETDFYKNDSDYTDTIDYIIDNDIAFYIPEVYTDVIERLRSVELIGGGENECLLEIEMLLLANNTKYTKNYNFTY